MAVTARQLGSSASGDEWITALRLVGGNQIMAAVLSTSKSRFMEFLTTPSVDKTIAVIAVTPNTLELFHRYTDANLTFVRGVLGIQVIILVITMVLRRPPVRVTPNPWYWLLAFVATYGVITFYAFAPTGTQLVP